MIANVVLALDCGRHSVLCSTIFPFAPRSTIEFSVSMADYRQVAQRKVLIDITHDAQELKSLKQVQEIAQPFEVVDEKSFISDMLW